MKKFMFLLIVALFGSCATLSPAGKWDYSITGTPNGNFSGEMTVAKKDKKTFTAVMKTADGELKFDKFEFTSKTKRSVGDFSYQGMSVAFTAEMKENEMAGNVSTQGMTFPFKATRKK